jgi:HSP20 family molecular chaperone IbpA
MNTILPPQLLGTRRLARVPSALGGETRKPHYDCQQQGETLVMNVFLPGVEASGIEIIVRGPDLIVVGRKHHVVRVNFAAAHLESAQLDYELRLRLGRDFDYAGLEATLADGILTLSVPKLPSLDAAA